MLDAKVVSTDDNWGNPVWGCEFYREGKLIKTEWYPTHNKFYAEDAAENYISGVKTIDESESSEIQLNLFDEASVKERVGG